VNLNIKHFGINPRCVCKQTNKQQEASMASERSYDFSGEDKTKSPVEGKEFWSGQEEISFCSGRE